MCIGVLQQQMKTSGIYLHLQFAEWGNMRRHTDHCFYFDEVHTVMEVNKWHCQQQSFFAQGCCCCLCLQVFSFMHHPSGLTNSYLGFALPSYSSRSHLNWEHQFSRVNIYLLLSPHSIRFLLLLFNIWPYVYTDNPPFKTWPLASRAT